MELLIEASLWQPSWAARLQVWQQQGHRWQLLVSHKGETPVKWPDARGLACPPDGFISPPTLLSAWLDGKWQQGHYCTPCDHILISASPSLLLLAKEQGLLTLGPQGADLPLTADADLGEVLDGLLARRLSMPTLCQGSLCLRALQGSDAREIAHYCQDEALSRYTLHIPHPFTPDDAYDWLAQWWRKGALGLGWSWAITMPTGEAMAPLVGVISLLSTGELAWWVGVPWQNCGLATRAGALVKQFAFEQRMLPALTACHMPDNLASGRVMAKLGMYYCGQRPVSAHSSCQVSYWRCDRPEPRT
ncbi:MAG: GNAT family N-acetyltransferase [Aeromonas sp.]